MTLKDIAFRNLRRRKAKAVFVLAGVLIAVATVVALISLIEAMNHDITHKLEKYGANILVVPRTENLPLSYGGLALGGVSFEMQQIREDDFAKVRFIKNAANIAALGPMVLGVVKVDNHKALLAGVDFKAAQLLKPWWKVRGEVPSGDGAVLGADAARVLGLEVGGRLAVNGRTLLVTGVLEPTGSQDDHIVFARLPTAQRLLGKERQISMAEVAALCKDCPIEDMVRQISEILPGASVMAIQQVVKSRMETLRHFRKFSYGVSAVVVLVGTLMVLVTMMGSVRERTSEIGIFRAIGFRRQHVITIVLLEAGILSATAGILGYLAGLGVSRVILPFFTESHGVAVPVDYALAGGALILAVLMGLMASAYPALMAAKLDPNEALRTL
jgi:putative ABC transport system permease protein